MANYVIVHGPKDNPTIYEEEPSRRFLFSNQQDAWKRANIIKEKLSSHAFSKKECVSFWKGVYEHTEEGLLYQKAADSMRVIEVKLTKV